MRILVAGAALRIQCQVGSGAVALGALYVGVAPCQRETRLLGVIETLSVDGAQLGVSPSVLRMAHSAITFDIAVHARVPRHSGCDRLMTLQAALCRGFAGLFVAVHAVVGALERGMSLRERPGRLLLRHGVSREGE